jgi:hypothetical protein
VGLAAATDHRISLIVPLSVEHPLPEIAAPLPSSRINIVIEFVLAEHSQKHLKKTSEAEQTLDTSPADRANERHGTYTEAIFGPGIAFALAFNIAGFVICFLTLGSVCA